jgi:7,8-dihydropterin-6-yl-methyl-4-(beta-D-ribofuranosyl)aminobenzene 5'-phosphate synthase
MFRGTGNKEICPMKGPLLPDKPRNLECLTIKVITDNYYDALRLDTVVSTRYRTVPGACIHAEHGLSYFVETMTVGGETGRLVFDYGVDPNGVASNMNLLGIDPATVDVFALSHGHFDHWGAFIDILKRNCTRIPRGTPFYVGLDAFAHRYTRRPGSDELHDLGFLDRDGIEGLGVLRIVEISEPTEVIPGAYLTGRIDRVTTFEQVPATFLIERNGGREQDLFRGEQAIVFVVRGRGLVVLSSCAHAGIVNTVKRAQEITGVDRVHAIIGGFHLINAAPEIIEATVAGIKAMAPEYIVPTHCTGFEAITRFREEMPEQFLLNTAGTTYVFAAADNEEDTTVNT